MPFVPVESVRRGRRTAPARRTAAAVVLAAAVLTVLLAVLSSGGAQARPVARPECTGLPPCILAPPSSGSGSPSTSPSASAPAAPSGSPALVPPPGSKGEPPWYDRGSVQALGGGAVAAVAGLALLVLLRREPSRTGPVARHAFPAPGGPPTVVDPAPAAAVFTAAAPPAPRPAELHRATVATDLHPQGYVEIDECLYRAVWSEPGEPPPDPGEPVEVGLPDVRGAGRDADVLLAFPQPQHPHRRHHA